MAEHGTRSRYQTGCSCEPCREANREATRRSRERARSGYSGTPGRSGPARGSQATGGVPAGVAAAPTGSRPWTDHPRSRPERAGGTAERKPVPPAGWLVDGGEGEGTTRPRAEPSKAPGRPLRARPAQSGPWVPPWDRPSGIGAPLGAQAGRWLAGRRKDRQAPGREAPDPTRATGVPGNQGRREAPTAGDGPGRADLAWLGALRIHREAAPGAGRRMGRGSSTGIAGLDPVPAARVPTVSELTSGLRRASRS